jgi:hypothetical protein
MDWNTAPGNIVALGIEREARNQDAAIQRFTRTPELVLLLAMYSSLEPWQQERTRSLLLEMADLEESQESPAHVAFALLPNLEAKAAEVREHRERRRRLDS